MSLPQGSYQSSINPPELDAGIIPRPRLQNLLRQYRRRRVILLQAPAGYGKTTLLASFQEQVDDPVCWISLTAADRDVSHLAGALRASLLKRFHRLRGTIEWPFHPETPPAGMARALAGAVAEHVEEPILLVFDDIQWINRSEETTRFVDSLLESLPSNVTLILAGREIPKLKLGRLVIDAEVGGVGIDELALTREETAELVQTRFQRTLTDAELDRLCAETEGWISGVLLSPAASDGATASTVSRAHTGVAEIMTSTVLGDQPPETRTFLRESSLLPRLTAEACDAILVRDDSREQLRGLVHKGLFVTALETEPKSYAYHPLLREALRQQIIEQEPERADQIRHQAAQFYQETGDVETAVNLLLETDDVPRAASLARQAARDLFQEGRLTTLETWAERFRDSQIETPEIYLDIAAGAFDRGELEKADRWVETALDVLNGIEDPNLQPRAFVVQGRIAIHRGQHRRALKLADRAEALLAPETGQRVESLVYRLKGLAFYYLGENLEEARALTEHALALLEAPDQKYTASQILLDLATIHDARGQIDEAEEAALKAHTLIEEFGSPLALAVAGNNLAVLAHRQGRYQRALALFQDALEEAQRAGSRRHEALLLLGLGDLHNDMGLSYQAGNCYGEALRITKQYAYQPLTAYGYLRTAVLHRRSGNGSVAREWLGRARAAQGDQDGRLALQLEEAALLLQSDPLAAVSLLHRLEADRSDRGMAAREATFLYYLNALGALILDRRSQATRWFQRACQYAGRFGSEQVLAGELHHDSRLLQLPGSDLAGDSILDSLRERIRFMELIASRERDHGTRAATAELSLLALGKSRVELSGVPVTSLSPLPRQLLFYLVDQQPVERDELLEAFWPEVDVKKQSSSLYSAVHHLRDALGKDLIEIDGSLYQLNSDQELHYDVAEFERTAEIAEGMPTGDARRALALAQAISYYKGPFLPMYHSDWVLQRRRALSSHFLDLLVAHAQAAQAKGQTTEALGSIERAVELAPLREDINLLYLQLLAAAGRRTEAIRHYHALTRQLSDELGLEPAEVLRDYYYQLLD